MGFRPVARHRSREVTLYRQGGMNLILNAHPDDARVSATVGGQIQLLAAFPVGPRERLLVVRMQDRILALGHTPTHISLLAELDDFEPMANSGSLPSGFAGQLMTLLSRKNSA
jgi:hypothetical protein